LPQINGWISHQSKIEPLKIRSLRAGE
jgi:excisionase family DNA binding protein